MRIPNDNVDDDGSNASGPCQAAIVIKNVAASA